MRDAPGGKRVSVHIAKQGEGKTRTTRGMLGKNRTQEDDGSIPFTSTTLDPLRGSASRSSVDERQGRLSDGEDAMAAAAAAGLELD